MPPEPTSAVRGPLTDSGIVAGDVLLALADPTRRAIFERVCAAPQPVTALAAGLPVSRPAVSQHLRALQRARLVTATRDGTRRIYTAQPEGLEILRAWVERHWDVVLSRFAEAAEQAERSARRAEHDPKRRTTSKSEPTKGDSR